MSMRLPRCARTSSMRADKVRRSCTRARNRRSEPSRSRAGRDTVGGKTDGGKADGDTTGGGSAFAAVGRRRLILEIDIPGVAQQLGLDRNVQAVVDGVVELPEADH